ncbi:MAG: class I SAM-dependent methyltransferase [Actinomycetota bacterium]|nr:class I SAM-dependent methyltransferase [Actinomycetota bacterium]
MDERLRAAAEAAPGFMPSTEGLALYAAALAAPPGPLLEIGSYCGKSAVYLGAAARARGTILYSIDHHRGSEEHQPGEGYHDPALADRDGRVDTFPAFRKTIEDAGLDDVVVPVVALSAVVARAWPGPLACVFVDGGHSQAAADADYEGWVPHVAERGLLAIHDVFEEPAEGGRPPYVIYRRAIDSGRFEEISRTGSLRVLERIAVG